MDSCLNLMEPYLYLGFPMRLICKHSEANQKSEEIQLMNAYKVSFYDQKKTLSIEFPEGKKAQKAA